MLGQHSQSLLDWQARTLTGESILDACDSIAYQNIYLDRLGGTIRLIWIARTWYKRQEAECSIFTLPSNVVPHIFEC